MELLILYITALTRESMLQSDHSAFVSIHKQLLPFMGFCEY